MISYDRRSLAFGVGDIQILIGAEDGNAFLIFNNLSKPEPVVSPVDNPPSSFYALQPDDVVMSFSCPESIDVMIQCLQKTRNAAFPNQP